ncbi:MAG: OmcA/MtrC family decaheme c-type cytochrome [Deltaproteobacteria bacterium]|nr:OmcA/MtrC family decaheme c-type cytochrome [Deltaproteobacteria bacterium]
MARITRVLQAAGGFVSCGTGGKILALLLVVAMLGPGREATAAEDDGTADENCIACHGADGFRPVGDISDTSDVHYVDLDPDGPSTPSGYRQVDVVLTSVDVTGQKVIIDFTATDEDGAGIADLSDSNGRFGVARLVFGADPGDPTEWQSLITSERFNTTGGDYQNLGGGSYHYASVFDPTTVPVAEEDTLRVAVQISGSGLPAGNGWCDFDADLVDANDDCGGPVNITRDIVQTAVCNGCHGVTSDTKLSFHGGGRTEVEYCVTCHNPGIGETDMTPLIHKIHYGANLANGFRDWSHVRFTRDADNCTSCHTGGGEDETNWSMEPNRTSCGSCHDDVNFDTGANHGSGGQQATNQFCSGCHPATGVLTSFRLPVEDVHQGVARAAEAAFYRDDGNGFSLDAVGYDPASDRITVDYSVTRDGGKMILQSDTEWTNGGSLRIKLGWSSEEYTNQGSGSTPAPAQPVSFSALDVGGTVIDLGGGNYRTVIDVPPGAFGNVTLVLEGRPVADLLGDGVTSRIPVRDAFTDVSIEPSGSPGSRRQVVDVATCNACHDAAGAGLNIHGDNRTGEIVACVTCHNPDATDIARRPADPSMALDGKKEEAVDFKRMIHQIHSGADLENGLVLYGFGGSPHDYSSVGFVGNRRNCLTCHEPETYSTEDAWYTLASTIDTGPERTDPTDDLNISQTAAACSSCHDDEGAKSHMIAHGASFMALDEDIVRPESIPVPEPSVWVMLLAGCAGLGVLHPLQRRRNRRRGLQGTP